MIHPSAVYAYERLTWIVGADRINDGRKPTWRMLQTMKNWHMSQLLQAVKPATRLDLFRGMQNSRTHAWGIRMSWQPIESAPKDGSVILIADQNFVGEGHWIEALDDGVDYMGNDEGFTDLRYSHFYPGRSFGAKAYMSGGVQPTHWMPLPEPPRLPVDEEAKP